jgi:hypothetical protein
VRGCVGPKAVWHILIIGAKLFGIFSSLAQIEKEKGTSHIFMKIMLELLFLFYFSKFI